MQRIFPLLGILAMLGPLSACSRSSAKAEIPPPDQPTFHEADVQAQGNDAPATQPQSRTAVFAGGCFWCTEAVFEQLEGVTNVVSGYAGGTADDANYEVVSAGQTKHAEVIQITYDPAAIQYGKLLQVFFDTAHDPTQLNAQGPDRGTQYRSAIFYQSDAEKEYAQAYINKLDEAGVFDKPIATTLEPLDAFYPAEQYHQDFVKLNPNHGYVRAQAIPKVEKTRKGYDTKDD